MGAIRAGVVKAVQEASKRHRFAMRKTLCSASPTASECCSLDLDPGPLSRQRRTLFNGYAVPGLAYYATLAEGSLTTGGISRALGRK